MTGWRRCCEEDWGGSHYHCAGCGAVTGMYGHYVTIRDGSGFAPLWSGLIPLPFEGHHCTVVIGLLRLFGHTGDLDPRKREA